MNNNDKMRRLFFALWPTGQIRQSIAKKFSKLPMPIEGRVIRLQNLHVTLHFIGQATEQTKECMHHAAKSFKAERFQLVLNHFDYFSKARVYWIGPQTVPAELRRLHKLLGAAISGCGYDCEERPYAPHISLVRKYRHPGPVTDITDFSILWQVNDFVLVESIPDEQGVNYQVIEKYPLS